MTLSIRARLTTWYSLVVVAVLMTSAIAVAIVERRMASDRLDGELQRLMMTLDGVMRTEFNEGLTIEAAAEEASIEVVAPDRVLVLVRPGGGLLAMWGLPFARDWRPNLQHTVLDTVVVDGRRYRLFSHQVNTGKPPYVAARARTARSSSSRNKPSSRGRWPSVDCWPCWWRSLAAGSSAARHSSR